MSKVLRYALFVILALMCLQSAFGLLVPPYSDQEIQDSLVDTWEVHAWWTMLVLGFAVPVAVMASPFAIWGRELPTRRFARLTLGLALGAGLLAVVSHAALTRRTSHLTGQTFSRFYGLF